MDELRFHFNDFQFLAFAVWLVFAFMMARRGMLTTGFGMTCLISVTLMIGYICLISFGILGSAYSPGLIFPNYDAYIEPFLLFLFGVPIIILAIVILLVLDFRCRGQQLQAISALYGTLSIYLLWTVLMSHVNVIASV